jgi:hypothetical protein
MNIVNTIMIRVWCLDVDHQNQKSEKEDNTE